MSMNETAPFGVPSDYYHETQVPAVWGFCLFVIFFGVLTLGLRFYARYTTGNSFWWDDWFALAVLPMMTLEAAVDIKTIDFGWGRHTIVPLNTNPLLLEDFYRYLFILTFSYSGGVAMFKCSALALYCRIFGIHRKFRWTCIGLGILILTWTGIVWFVHIFRCDPIRGQWNHRGATCILNLEEIHSMISIPTVIFGAITLLLPVKLVWQLKLGLPQRIGLLFAFLLGGLDIIISIIRYRVIVTIPQDDPMWKSLPTMYWSLGEPVAGLLCCCIPVYAPFLNALRRKLGLTTVGSSNGNSGQGGHSSRSRSGSHGISKSRTRGGTFGNSQDTKSSSHVGTYPSFYRHESGSDTVELTELEKQDIDRPDKVYYIQDRRWR